MRRRKYWPFILLSSLVIACSSPVYVTKDDSANLSDYRTYMWVETRENENDNSARPTQYVDLTVHNAVNAQLSKQGWREVSDNPDVLISYDVLVERTTAERTDPVYTRSFTRMVYNPYRRRWTTIYYPSQFAGYQSYEVPVKEGTITITMVDANTDKVVWQAWTTEQLNNSRITNEEISKSIRNIFNKFDVAIR